MSELFRGITKEEFDRGVESRLKLGEFTVGNTVTLSADMPGPLPSPQYRRALVYITHIKPISIDDRTLVHVKYEFEYSRVFSSGSFETGKWGTLLAPDSIAWVHRQPSAYFSHQGLETWEQAVATELADVETRQLIA